MATLQPAPENLGRDVVWNLVPVALLAIVGLGMNFAITWGWGRSALGSFNQVTTAYFVAAAVASFGINYSVIREVASADNASQAASAVLGGIIPVVAIGAATTAAFVVVSPAIGQLFDSSAVSEGALWVAPGLFFFTVNKVLLGAVNGAGRMRAFAVYTSIRYLLIAAGLLIAHQVELTSARLPAVWSFAEGGLLLVLIGEIAATVKFRLANEWRVYAARHLRFGSQGIIATLCFEFNSRLDVWVLGAMLSDSAVGIYSMAASINEGAQQLPVVLQNNINPRLAQLAKAGDTAAIATLVRECRRWFVPLLAIACIFGAVVFPFVVPRLAGDSAYIDGSAPFAIFMVGLAVTSPLLPFQQVLLMIGHPLWHTIIVTVWMILNLGLTIVLAKSFGFVGAAIAASIAMALGNLAIRAVARNKIGPVL